MKLKLMVFNKQQGIEEQVWTFLFTPMQLHNYAKDNGYIMKDAGRYVKETDHSVMTLKLQLNVDN